MNEMEAKIKKCITHYIFLFVMQLFNLIFFLFILDVIYSPKNEEKKFPGIDIREFR